MADDEFKARAARQELLATWTPEQQAKHYAERAHAVQSATAWEMTFSDGHSPKHLRTGLNLLRAEQGGLAVLLLRKGIITESEYRAAMLEGAEEEVAMFERLAAKRGMPQLRFA